MKRLKMVPYEPAMKQPVIMICTAVLKEIESAMQLCRGAALVILGVDEEHEEELAEGNLTVGGHLPSLNVPSYLDEVKNISREIADCIIAGDCDAGRDNAEAYTVTRMVAVYLKDLQCPKENFASETRSVVATAAMNLINTLIVDYIQAWNKRNGDKIIIRLNTHAFADDGSVVSHAVH